MNMAILAALMLGLFAVNMRLFLALFLAVLFYFVFFAAIPMQISVQQFIGPSQNNSLLAIPFFILLGTLMSHTGIAERMLKVADLLVGKLTGGMALANILLSTLMGGISASNLADASMLSRMMVPEMEKKGYSRAFAAAVTASGSLITPIIPPGIALIIYGLVADVSIGQMFVAGILPGLLCAALLMLTVYIVCKRRGYVPTRQNWPDRQEVGSVMGEAWPALILIVAIIGGIRFNIFTPTEAGAFAVAIVLIIGFFIYRQMKVSHVTQALVETAKSTSAVMLVIMASSAIAWVFSLEHAGEQLAQFIVGLTSDKYTFLIAINAVLLLLGMLIEGTAIMIILVPLLMPAVNQLGIDPVHFGIVMILNLAIGTLTPPVGTVMLLVCNITKVRVIDFIKESGLLFLALLAALILITFIPAISTALI
ncbi:TRAP transporter large permease [Pseudomonas paeninsulae]|uniref:TRAP transporter large permease n=1 Tax=Pseudomonas paeninsulae TaxID=3110772 RepID=UPI002D770C5E|nr:TRAP transporter large permease [Pseudomonas sp. IT1137]